MNKVNVTKFLELLKKSTCNYSIDNVGLTFSGSSYKVGMRGSKVIIILKGDNDIISGISATDTWDLNFSEPSKNVKTYFDLIIPDDNDEANVTIKDEKIMLKSGTQKSNLFFCSENIISRFNGTGPKVSGDTVYECEITEDFMDTYGLVKKVSSGFGKIYFTADDGDFSMEATDKTNSYSNGMKMSIGESKYEDVAICFEYKTFNNIITILGDNPLDFKIRVSYIKKNRGGMITITKNDDSEVYYILSSRENI